MTNHQIYPERITKPIQLLAAWLLGLILVDSAFLTGASVIAAPSWAAGLLVIAAVINVPLFLVAIFILQTRFRPELQADAYYSEYLVRSYSAGRSEPDVIDPQEVARDLAEHIVRELGPAAREKQEPIERIIAHSQLEDLVRRFGGSRSLTELYVRPELWPNLVSVWRESELFMDDVNDLVANGLAEFRGSDFVSLALTELGRRVASHAERSGTLWRDEHASFFAKEGKRLAEADG